MMVFFLISGAVNRNLPKKAWPEVLRGSLRLLALAWVVHIIGTLVNLALKPELRSSAWNVVYAFVDPIVEGYLWSVGVLWFLTALCFVQILAYLTLRRFPALAVVLVATAAAAVTPYLPEQYLLKTWLPGLAFFALGYLFSQWQIRWPFWAAFPLLAVTILLAPLNHGCSYSFTNVCGTVPFGVRMFAGSFGYLPMFFLSSLAGSLTVVAMSAGLARFSASSLLAYMGRKSLELFIINGFVATFLFSAFQNVPWPELTVFHYIGLFVAIVAAHLLALQILKPVLGLINAAALAISAYLTRLLAGDANKTAARPV
jgi:hypothetical protein